MKDETVLVISWLNNETNTSSEKDGTCVCIVYLYMFTSPGYSELNRVRGPTLANEEELSRHRRMGC